MPRDCPAFARGGEVLDMFTRLRPNRAKKRVGRFTQGAARGLALPWANEWLRLWREAGIGFKARATSWEASSFPKPVSLRVELHARPPSRTRNYGGWTAAYPPEAGKTRWPGRGIVSSQQ